jgi:hypothetical protein
MGLIVKRTQPSTATREELRRALTTTLSDGDDVERVLDELAAQTPPPSTIEVDRKGFAIALGIFIALLVVSIAVDALNWVDDPSAYVGLAATALGAVLGFVTGEISGTSSG